MGYQRGQKGLGTGSQGRRFGERPRRKNTLETVIEMKNEGLTDDVIARVTKLPIDRIREIHL
jgi:hypothetical protein